MTRRAWVLGGTGLVVVLAVAYALQPEPQFEPKVSVQECGRVAAEFLGARPDELTRSGTVMLLERPSRRRPPIRVFVLPYLEAAEVQPWSRQEGRAWVIVDAWEGVVTAAEYPPRRYDLGTRELTEAEAKAAAQAFLTIHWAHWAEARFGSASPVRRFGQVFKPQRAPEQSFGWLVREGDIHLGGATVTVNLSTGQPVSYAQSYYPAHGLAPPQVTKQQAISEAVGRLDAGMREKAQVRDAYLGTRWYRGEIRLAWVVSFSAPAGPQGPPGQEPHVHDYTVVLDAYNGEVYTSPLPEAE